MNVTSSHVLGATVALLAVAATATVAVGRHGVTELPDDSPEGAVQAYVSAVVDEDGDGAVALLEPTTACTAENFEEWWFEEDTTVTLQDTSVSGASSTVTVRITHSTPGLVPGQWSEEVQFLLRRTDGAWLITGEPWPYPGCGKVLP